MMEKNYLVPRTRDYPPRATAVAAGDKMFMLDLIRGEGYFDFLYVNVSDASNATIVVEVDSDLWLRRSVASMRLGATGLGLDAWFGLLGVQVYNPTDGYYGVSVVPPADTVPFWRTLRVWVENSGTSEISVRNGYLGYRIKEALDF